MKPQLPAIRGSSRVRWLARAGAGIPPRLCEQLSREIDVVFDEPGIEEITVHNVFAGYTNDQDRKVILGVEVRADGRFETHIVKIGADDVVKRDYTGWRGCAGNRYIGSRIFVRLHMKDLSSTPMKGTKSSPERRSGVIYEDAYTLFGLDPKTQQPEFLEDVIGWAVLDDKPDPVSVERVLSQVYGDLFRWFYYAGQHDANAARSFYEQRLKKALPVWGPGGSTLLHDLRRDATWLLGGLDTPDSQEPADYLDPHDYVCWALASGDVPESLVGCSHGDLHGRNILVGVRRGEAEFPVVIDYGEMDQKNLLVWDFVKLETEIKVRLLPKLFDDSDVVALLMKRRGDKPPRGGPAMNRARRLALVFEFEALLADATQHIDGVLAAESRQPPGGRPVFAHNRKVDRALSIFLRIRQEAALWLGFSKHGRHTLWRDEYLFALAVYGLSTAKWSTYEPQNSECALVSAGVAVAQMEQTRRVLLNQISAKSPPPASSPSYRPALAHGHRLLNAGNAKAAKACIEDAIDSHPYAVPLLTEQAMILADLGDLTSSLALVGPLQESCRIFGDHETLTRVGKTYKKLGDREWERAGPPYVPAGKGTSTWQLYLEAFGLYKLAYEISGGNYFPGVNLVTLALLLGDKKAAREFAEGVLATCAALHIGTKGQDLYWVFVSEGEAALGSNRPNRVTMARSFYASALSRVGASQIRMVHSSWCQLCRLRCILGPSAIDPIVKEFRMHRQLWTILESGPLGDCGLNGKR